MPTIHVPSAEKLKLLQMYRTGYIDVLDLKDRLKLRPVVRWIDDRNEAAALGVSVDELLAARKVEAALVGNDIPAEGRILVSWDLRTPSPRHHNQIVGITV
jgi:hypothetical protein